MRHIYWVQSPWLMPIINTFLQFSFFLNCVRNIYFSNFVGSSATSHCWNYYKNN